MRSDSGGTMVIAFGVSEIIAMARAPFARAITTTSRGKLTLGAT